MQSVTDPEIRQIAKTFLDEIMRDMEPAINRFIPHQFEAMEQAYAREFTLEELTQVNQFAQTQAGQRYLQRSQTLLNDPDVVAANQAFFEDAQRIRAARMPILIERMRAYREQHTDSVTKP